MYRSLLLTLTLAALVPLDALAVPCAAQGTTTTVTGANSFSWDIDQAGIVVNGTIDSYDGGMALLVDGVDFPVSTSALNGNEVTVGPATLSGLNVTRRIYVSQTSNYARWIDLFENPTGGDITVDITYETNTGSDSGTAWYDSSDGTASFELGDVWVATDDATDGGGDPSLSHNLTDGIASIAPTAVSTSVFSCFGTEGVGWDYENIVIPAGQTIGLMSVVGQNQNRADASANAALFADPATVLEDIDRADKNAIVNWSIAKNILFVSDTQADQNIPTALSVDHTVTTLLDEYVSATRVTTALAGDLSAYDAVIWSATGTGFGALNDDAAMLLNLETYVMGGGRVYVTGYDSIDSPDDPDLATFVGGTGPTADLVSNFTPGPLATEYTSLTTGVIDIRGVVPADGHTDRDGLTGLAAGTIPVATSASNFGQWQWVVRPLGLGEIAYVSNGAYQNHPTHGNAHPSWTDPTSAYYASLLNFVEGSPAVIQQPNTAPSADAGGPYAANEGASVTLDASATTDVENNILTYAWDCENDGVVDIISTSPTGDTCTYPTGGVYTVALEVTDAGGLVGTATGTATINGAPTASAGGPYLTSQGVAVTIDASASSDAEGAVSYDYDCDTDGTVDFANAGQTQACLYPDVGNYTVTVTVTDAGGLTDDATASVTVINLAPSADAGGPYSGTKGFPVALDGSASSDVDGTIVSWDWDCQNDGVVDITAAAGTGDSCTYNAVGTYTIGLVVTDDDGGTDSATVSVSIGNDAPVASAGGPYAGTEGIAIPVDGSASSDAGPAGGIVTYSWDCDTDGVADVVSASGTGSSCTYDDQGTFTVTLTVTDNDGATGSASASVTVSNAAPAIGTVSAPDGDEGVAIAFSATATDVAADPLTYAWDFGDGNSGSGASANHSYDDDGTYTVTVTVTDDEGASSSSSETVVVANVAPDISTVAAPSGDEGTQLSFSATATDVPADPLTYAWDFGDGNTGTGASPTHTYADDGSYSVTVTVTDDEGASSSSTVTATVNNTAPVINSVTGPSGPEGTPLVFAAVATDVPADVLTYSWDFGDGNTGTGASPTHTYPDDGTFTVNLTVSDDEGASATSTVIVSVTNVAPAISSVTAPSGDEGTPIAFGVVATDVPGDPLTYAWTFGDTSTGTGANPTHTYADDGTYTVTVTATDDEGASSTQIATVTVTNAAPTIASVTAPSGDEGSPIVFGVVATDVAADTLTYAWDFGDGGTDSGTAPTHTYADDGAYTVTVTVTDDDGGSTSQTASVSIANLAPVLGATSVPGNVDEGASFSASATATDVPGDTADLVYTWSWGDGSANSTGATPSHAYDDDGIYTVNLTVDDQDGGTDSETFTVVVANVAPTIITNPGLFALQGSQYTYSPAVTDPGDEVFAWSLSASASPNVVFDTSTGELIWTPDATDVAMGSFSMTLTVNDGDGATDAQSWTVSVSASDSDNDGMSDDFENANGLDPNDPSDAAEDPDLDGLTNLDEFQGGTDPNVFDGPAAPVAVSPLTGDEVADLRPVLTVDNALDPNGDALTYTFEVYEDAALTTLVTSVTGVAEDGSGQTGWEVDLPLTENAEYWWRGAASDAHVSGAFSTEESFFVNATEETPDVPVLTFPIAGETVDVLTPTLMWSESADADGDVVTYEVEVYDIDGLLVTSTTGVVGDGLVGEWTVDVTLIEDAVYDWSVRATDDTGLSSDWAVAELFLVSEVNGAPSDTVFLAPADGQSLIELSPDLVAAESFDPEGTALSYDFELDTVASFDSGDYQATSILGLEGSDVTWSLSDDGIELPENGTVYARVRAVDADGISSVPDTISFFVRGPNDAPSPPTLVSPEDATVGAPTPELVVDDGVDPDGDDVRIEFIVARDAELTDVVTMSTPLAGLGTTSWTVDVELSGELFWSARSIDGSDAASDWAAPWTYEVEGSGDDDDSASGDDDDDDDDDTRPAACDCQSSVSSPSEMSWMLVLLPVAALLRRRRA